MTSGRLYRSALALWPVFLVTAVALGAIRESVIAPALGEQSAHVIGTLLFLAALLAIMRLFIGRVRRSASRADRWKIGALWTALTLSFEFGFFHFVAGVPWETLLADYNLAAGRLWVLALLTTCCGPVLLGHLTDRQSGDKTSPG